MRITKLLRNFVLVAGLVASPSALAQFCVGFTDVSSSHGNCGDIEWIKNRGITTGCGGTLFCPTATVTRETMAAFLARAGKVLTPLDLPLASNTTNGHNLEPVTIIRCQTQATDVPAATHPRRAYFNSKVNVFAPSANVVAVADVMYSTNGGASWTAVTGTQVFHSLRTGQTPADDVSMYVIGNLNVDPGVSIIFGIRIERYVPAGGTPGTTANIYCENRVQITNRTSTVQPYDPNESPYERTGRAADRPPQ